MPPDLVGSVSVQSFYQRSRSSNTHKITISHRHVSWPLSNVSSTMLYHCGIQLKHKPQTEQLQLDL